MSELTLDEAIKHCLEVAEENDRFGGFGIEIFDYISVSKLAVKGLR